MHIHDCITMLIECFELQTQKTMLWHEELPEIEPPKLKTVYTPSIFKELVVIQHLFNFKIWHEEDIARRRDIEPILIAECKRSIDQLNQQRNDFMEQIDIAFLNLIQPLLPTNTNNVHTNTESLGMAIDRSSILSLKIWHMNEQVERSDVTIEHIENCKQKLHVLKEQHIDLNNAILNLVNEFHQGIRKPKLYFQYKMYNNPSLNPQLYSLTS